MGVEQILENLGFVLVDGTDYVFNGNDTSNLQKTLILLEAKMMQLNAPVSTADPEILKRNNEELARKQARDEELRKQNEAKFKGSRQDKEAQLRDQPLTDSVGNKLQFGMKMQQV